MNSHRSTRPQMAPKTQTTETYFVILREGVSKQDFINTLQNNLKQDSAITINYEHVLNGFAGKFVASDVEDLKRHPDVEVVEKDTVGSIQDYQNDATWGLGRLSRILALPIGDRPLPNKFFYHWDRVAGAGSDVYVVDTGVEISHPGFGGRALWGTTITGTDKKDLQGHGTHVAGTAISKQLGVAKSANVIAVKVLEQTTYDATNLVKGLDWVAGNVKKTKRPSVVNISLGGPASTAVDAAIKRLFDDLIPVVVAAGNDNKDAGSVSPARSPYAITVGASNIRDKRWASSNYGSVVNVFAPGEDVDSLYLNGTTKVMSGTSMAAPHVSGLMAYLLSTRTKVPLNFWAYGHVGVLQDIPAKTPNLLAYNNHYDLTDKLAEEKHSPVVEETSGYTYQLFTGLFSRFSVKG